jgi:hypothetical protein
MPGEENLSELSDQLANSPDTSSDQLQQGYQDDNGQAERLLPTSQQGDRTQNDQSQKNQLLAGKYKTAQELEKAYRSQNQGYRQLQTKAQQLEQMINNPKFQQMAANDPEMREALRALGYELMDEENRQEERQERNQGWDGNTNSPDFKIAVLEHRQQMFIDRLEFQEELGRKLTPQEWSDVRKQIQMAPRLSIKSAWKLTPHFDKEMEAKQQKALEAANRRSPIARPKPVSQALGGPKGPQGKSPLGLGEGEKGQFIQDLIDKAERGG